VNLPHKRGSQENRGKMAVTRLRDPPTHFKYADQSVSSFISGPRSVPNKPPNSALLSIWRPKVAAIREAW
jgi:hypothetical protein